MNFILCEHFRSDLLSESSESIDQTRITRKPLLCASFWSPEISYYFSIFQFFGFVCIDRSRLEKNGQMEMRKRTNYRQFSSWLRHMRKKIFYIFSSIHPENDAGQLPPSSRHHQHSFHSLTRERPSWKSQMHINYIVWCADLNDYCLLKVCHGYMKLLWHEGHVLDRQPIQMTISVRGKNYWLSKWKILPKTNNSSTPAFLQRHWTMHKCFLSQKKRERNDIRLLLCPRYIIISFGFCCFIYPFIAATGAVTAISVLFADDLLGWKFSKWLSLYCVCFIAAQVYAIIYYTCTHTYMYATACVHMDSQTSHSDTSRGIAKNTTIITTITTTSSIGSSSIVIIIKIHPS